MSMAGYAGPHACSLKPWPHPYFDENDSVAKVALGEVISGALWQSTAGTLDITGSNGRSGSVSADLTFTGGQLTPPMAGLHIAGQWTCADCGRVNQ